VAAFKLGKEQQGGIVLEAALILPLFLAFVLALIMIIQIALVEMALQSAVSETTKAIATQMYPARLLILDAKAKYEQSRTAKLINSAVDRVQNARSRVIGAEDWVEDYAAFIPDPLLEILKWEKEKRQLGEGKAQSEYDKIVNEVIQPRINAAFTPIVYAFSDGASMKKDKLKVISVTFPSLESGGEAYFGIEAQFEFHMIMPFISKNLILKKRAYERAWLGT
jgi:Flp pilus assembly protein TadG